MYIYIYCIYISHKKIQRLPPPRRVASVARAFSRNCSDDRFLGRFWGGSVRDSSSSMPTRRVRKPPRPVASRAERRSANRLLLSAGSPSLFWVWFPPPPPSFLHFCCLGTKSSRFVSENTINKINHDSEPLIIHDAHGWYDECVA